MTLPEAIELEVARTGNPRLRWLCSSDNPDTETRDAYRALVLRMAGEPEPPLVHKLEPDPATLELQKYFQQHGCGGCN